MKLVELLNRANAGYEDGYLANYFDPKTGAREYAGSGDVLAEFIVAELSETFIAGTDEEQTTEAMRVLERARARLQNCIDALEIDAKEGK